MDYDENDFQNQNHHLAGDTASRFPPLLNSYALPKFDFDDNIQGHLRFDSLVESEAFLGIESNEDNRWIEDFSRGSCGIDFSKSAADPCSISRCHNVWSEATSSESVEMLLKSVGHEEAIPKQSVAQASDAFDGSACLIEKMETNVIGDLQPTFPLEELPGDSSRLTNDSGIDVDVGLQDHTEAVEKDSSNMDLDTSGKSVLLAEEYLIDGGKSMDLSDSGRVVDGLIIHSTKNDSRVDISCSEYKLDTGDTVDGDDIFIEEKLKSQEEPHSTSNVSSKDGNDLQKSNDLLSGELHTLENDYEVKMQRSDDDGQHVNRDETNWQNSNIDAVESVSSDLDGVGKLDSCVEIGNGKLDSCVEIGNEENAGRAIVSTVTETSILEFDTGSVAGQHSVEEVGGVTTLQACTSQDAPEDVCTIDQSVAGRHSVEEVGGGTTIQACTSQDAPEDVCTIDQSVAGRHSVEEVGGGTTIQACTSPDAPLEDFGTIGQSNENVHAESKITLEANEEICGHQVNLLTCEQDADSFLQSEHVGEEEKSLDDLSVGETFEGIDDPQVEGGCSGEHSLQINHVENKDESGQVVGGEEDAIEDHQDEAVRSEQGIDSYSQEDHTEEKDKSVDGHLAGEKEEEIDVPRMEVARSELGIDSSVQDHAEVKGKSGDGQLVGGEVGEFDDEHGNLQGDNVEKNKSVDSQSVADELQGDYVASSEQEKVSKPDAVICMTGECVEVLMDTVAAVTTGSSNVEVPVETTSADNQQLSPSQVETEETREVNGHIDPPDPCGVPVYKEESTMLLSTSSNMKGGVGVPFGTDDGVVVPSVDKSGNTEDAIADHEKVNESENVVIQSSHMDGTNNTEVEVNGGDTPTKHSDSNLAVLKNSGSESEVVENEQSRDTTIPECTPVPETGYLECHEETQTAEVRVTVDYSSSRELSVHLPGVTSKGGSSVEVAISPEKPKETSELESNLSVDASKPLESTSVSVGPSPEGLIISDAPEDGRKDHHHSNNEISDGGNGNDATSGKEIGVSEIPIAVDVGKSGPEEHATKDGTCISGPEEQQALISEKSTTFEIMQSSPPMSGPVHTGTRVQRSGKRKIAQTAVKESKSSKVSPDSKPRRASTRSAGRGSAKKGNLVKDIWPSEQAGLPVKATNVSLGPPGIYQLVPPREIVHPGQMESLSTKLIGAVTGAPSGLPDLNSSAFPLVFQQPFNDIQQVQLRAQILVYGSLISKLVPEESHMVSAYGGPDGGQNLWEKVWQTCKARASVQTPHPVNFETPTSSRPGDMASDSALKQSKVFQSPAARAGTCGTPTPSINPMMPLSSPLWSLPTPSLDIMKSSGLPRGAVVDFQPVFPQVASQQTQPIISYVGPTTTWMSPAPFHGPWGASPHAPVFNTNRFPAVPTESVKLTPSRESSLGFSPAMTQALAGPSALGGVTPGSTASASSTLDLAKVMVQPDRSSDPKSKKRKKGPSSEDQSRGSLQPQSHAERLSVPNATSIPSASATDTTAAGSLSAGTGTLEFNVGAFSTQAAVPDKEADTGKMKPILTEDAIAEVKEVGKQAENAAALAAAAVNHSQELWNQLNQKTISNPVSDLEARLACSAVAISAAAAVAKAAAAAANVALDAALQAKAMAVEALTTGGCNNLLQSGGNSLGSFGPNISSSIILAAKEAARRRVDATSSAALRAENLDRIVKAAEWAAEAISQTGLLVTMGDPSSLSRLAEVGPEGFWKLPQFSSEHAPKAHDRNMEGTNNENILVHSIDSQKSSEGPPDNGSKHLNQNFLSPVSEESLRNPMANQVSLIVGLQGSVAPADKDRMEQELATTSVTVDLMDSGPESQYGQRSQDNEEREYSDSAPGVGKHNHIHQGSRVEVFKDGDDYKGAWFAADVVSLKDGKAHVCYAELPSIEGSGKLQEWVNLNGSGDAAPRIRIPHPLTNVQLDGSRKRRRAAIGSFTCSVGDKVDAWIQNSWWEGVVTEKKDETSATILLPVLGETSVIRAWHLRPSLIWMNGEWIEWSNAREDVRSHHEGDTPKEKRAKLGSSGKQAKGKEEVSRTAEVLDPYKDEGSKLLDLSAKDTVFNAGKAGIDEGKPGPGRTVRSGLRKQGPGVIFGVPKPGKKRKFMDVSKHYVGDQSDKAEVSDSVKLANYLMPRGNRPSGLKNSRTDVKGNEEAEQKNKVPATVKSRIPSGRTAPQKISSRSTVSASNISFNDSFGSVKDFSGHVGKHNIGTSSFSSSSTRGSFSFSSRAPSDANKKMAPKSDPVHKEKPASTGGRLARIKEDDIMNSSSQGEPRRSVRRIQPTSRLLEGLQSSLSISKVPSVTHDKGQKGPRGATKGSNQ